MQCNYIHKSRNPHTDYGWIKKDVQSKCANNSNCRCYLSTSNILKLIKYPCSSKNPCKSSGWVKPMQVFRMRETPHKSSEWVKVHVWQPGEWKPMQVFRMSEVHANLQDGWTPMQVFMMQTSAMLIVCFSTQQVEVSKANIWYSSDFLTTRTWARTCMGNIFSHF